MKNVIILMLLFFATKSNSQQLTVSETINYINESLTKNSHPYFIDLSSDGYLTIKYYDYYSSRIAKDYEPKVRDSYKMHCSEIKIEKKTYPNLCLEFICKNSIDPCITIKTNYADSFSGASKDCHLFSEDNYQCDKLYNAFEYLFSEISESNEYGRNDDDPFAPQNFSRENIILGKNTIQKVKLEKNGGVYKLNVKISELPVNFILDSGASSVSISSTIEKKLASLGAIKKTDYIQPALYKLADGSIIKCRRLFLKNITIGNFTVKNVLACVGESNSPLLLGKSFLDSFSKWSIDNSRQELILEK
ncbi:retroviral-like aspartic protease family protein [uncultured Flavobacterium sp.]|uniref:retroviral-like aspartic protease family protein n=1 Tax=uncultured Flavobacterium sp. TaxID=165435 RepID=UPI0025EA4226|nr:retroviral-like aspartic protease family protein [uncultured Flavobacterium sp.]